MYRLIKDPFQGKKFVGVGLIRASLGFMIVFVLVVALGFVYIVRSLMSNYESVRQTSDLRTQLLTLENAMMEEQTGQRGYLLSRRTEFLAPFERGTTNYVLTVEALQELVQKMNASPEIEEGVLRVIDSGGRWKSEFGDVQIRKVMAGGTVTEQETIAAKRQFDLFRLEITNLLKDVDNLRSERGKYMLHYLYMLFTVMGIVFVSVQILMLNYLQKGLTRITKPIMQLDRAVSSYEYGNIQERLPDYKEDNEIGRLVLSFKRMHEDMETEKHTLQHTYHMINTLHQSRSLETFYRNLLTSICSLKKCERSSIITRNADGSYSVKAVCVGDAVLLQEQPLHEELSGVEQMLSSGFSTIYNDWTKQRIRGPLTEELYEKGIRSSMHIILRNEERMLGVLNLLSEKTNFFTANKKDRVEKLSPMIVTAHENARETVRIRNLAMRDGLTGLWNRRYFEQMLDGLLARQVGAAEQKPLALILLDIDYFKTFNDTWGHPEGDLVLKHVGRLMQENLGEDAISIRFGGEEFAILLPGASLKQATDAAERFRKQLESDSPSRKYKITASFGVAATAESGSKNALVEAADRALYRAKEEGRNRVCTDSIDGAPDPDGIRRIG